MREASTPDGDMEALGGRSAKPIMEMAEGRLARLRLSTLVGAAMLAAASAGIGLASLAPALANPGPGWAELQQADLALGHRLIDQHRCSECHIRRVGGDGSAIYRPAGRINKPSALLAMVEMCNTELNLQLFPDDVAAVAAALNQKHYRFKPSGAS